jgi:PAS domain S-box-containing protein
VFTHLIKIIFPEYCPESLHGSFFTRKRILLFMFLFISITAIFFILYNSSQILDSYNDIEEENMDSSIRSLEESIFRQAVTLQKTTNDYAGWDDTAQYVRDHNSQYELNNLNLNSLKNLGVTFVSVIQQDGNLQYLKWYDSDSDEELSLSEPFLITSTLVADNQVDSFILWSENHDSLLISKAPITSSDGTMETGYLLYFGIPLDPIIKSAIKDSDITSISVTVQPLPDNSYPYHSFSLIPPGKRTVTAQNDSVITGEFSLPAGIGSPTLNITIQRDKRFYAKGKAFVTPYFWRSIAFTILSLLMGMLVMIELIRRYDHTHSLIGSQEKEIEVLKHRREILDKFHVILDRYLHAGPDSDQNIQMIVASAGGLFEAEYLAYIRVDNGKPTMVSSWPNSVMEIQTLLTNLVSTHHPYKGYAEGQVIPLPLVFFEDTSRIALVNPTIHAVLFRSIRPCDETLGYFFMFLSSVDNLDETNQIVLDLLINALNGEEKRRVEQISLHKRDIVLEAIGHSATRLLSDLSISSIVEILHAYVNEIGVDEAHLFIWKIDDNEELLLTHDYCWSSESSRNSSHQLFWEDLMASPIRNWISKDSSPGIRAGLSGNFPDAQDFLQTQGIRSIVLIPLLSQNEFIGALFLIDRKQDRIWLSTELEALNIASSLIMATIAKIENDEEIREREENFKQFFNNIRDFIFVLDTDGRIITANLFALQEVGIKPSELRGMHLSGIFTSRWIGSSPISEETLFSAISPERAAILLTIDGKEIPVELRQLPGIWNGEQAIFCICKDISGLKRSEHKFATAFRSSQVLHAIWNLRNDRLIDVNETFCNTLGFCRDDLLSRTQFSPGQVFDYQQIQKTKEVILTLGSIRDFDITLKTKKGEERAGSLYGALIEIDGQPCILYSIVDITDKKRAEIRIQALLHELSASNMELQNFAHVVAHDLKEPLRGIYSLVSWISEDNLDGINPKGQRYLQMIFDQIQRMNELIDGILTYSQAGFIRDEGEDVPVQLIVSEVIDTLSPPDTVRITIETELPVIFGERTKVRQVFQNIISNSLSFIPPHDGQITIRSRPHGDFWLFEISDNGPGIDPSLHGAIFEIFSSFSQSPDNKGTGIGLAIVKRIIDTTGGSVWVESVPGNGATFCFTLLKSPVKDSGPGDP